MTQVIFDYPEQALYNRVIPKTKIYEHARPGRKVRDSFVTDIDKITWKYVLAPRTINIPATENIEEIAVFEISLRTKKANEAILRTIDKAIRMPTFYHLHFKGDIKSIAAYKRQNEADPGKWVVDAYFETMWLKVDCDRAPLPPALNLDRLYEQMLRMLIPSPNWEGESLKDQVERLQIIESKTRECEKLQMRLKKEKQFNRKVEINSQLKELKNQLAGLTG
jgi:hypothetical protein